MSLLDLINGNSTNSTHQSAQTRYALAYLRVSTEEQNEEAQRADIERYAARESMTVLEWFSDHAKTASSDHESRSDFWRMVDAAKADKRVSLILVWDESRFMRDRLQATVVKADLLAHGVKVIPVKHPYDAGTVDGVILESLHQALAQVEAMKIAERTIAGMAHNCTQRDPNTGWAYHNGGRPAYGYRVEKVQAGRDKHDQPVHKESWFKDEEIDAGRPRWEWVRVILLDWMVNERASDKEIVRRLNRLGVKTFEKAHGIITKRKRKDQWNWSTLHYMRQPEKLLSYAGWYSWNKHQRRKPGKQRRKRKPPNEWQWIENAHEPILTLEEAQTVQAEVERRHKPRRCGVDWHSEGSPYLFTGGLAVCRCGANLVGRGKYGQAHRHGDDIPRYYVCGSINTDERCGPTYCLPCDELHEPIWQAIGQAITSGDERIEELTRRVNQRRSRRGTEHDAERKALQKRLKEIDRDRERLREAFRAGADVQFIADESQRLRSEEEDAGRQLADLQAKTDATSPRPITANDLRRLMETTTYLMKHGTNEQKRQLLRVFVKGATLYPDEERADVEFLQPDDVKFTAPRNALPA